jgi:ribosomal protein S18 acetylase RimI-like enzyme
MTRPDITEWLPGLNADDDLDGLAAVLHATVLEGASVGFVLPFSMEDALSFWRDRTLPALRAGGRRVWVARVEARIVGTVQLILDTPPNQRHRAEIAKLLVHPDARRMGLGRALMLAAEAAARAEQRSLLTLDTRTGDRAEPLYQSLGYVTAGIIPAYARGPHSPALEATSIMYKVMTP